MRLLFIINSLKWPVFTHLYTMCCKCKYPFHAPCWSVLIQPSVNIYAFATICNLKSEYAVQIESVLLAVVMEIQQLDSLEVIQRSDGKRLKMRTCNTGLNVESTRSLAGPTGNKCAWVCAPSEKIMSIVRCRGCFLIPPLSLLLFSSRPSFSSARSLTAASTSSWMRSTAFTMWLLCWRSSSGTCPTLF